MAIQDLIPNPFSHEMPLACTECGKRLTPRHWDTFVAAYQPDMQLDCPECGAALKCCFCGFVYGKEELEDEPEA